MSENGGCSLKDENEFDNLFFLFCNEFSTSFILFFIFAVFNDGYQFSQIWNRTEIQDHTTCERRSNLLEHFNHNTFQKQIFFSLNKKRQNIYN